MCAVVSYDVMSSTASRDAVTSSSFERQWPAWRVRELSERIIRESLVSLENELHSKMEDEKEVTSHQQDDVSTSSRNGAVPSNTEAPVVKVEIEERSEDDEQEAVEQGPSEKKRTPATTPIAAAITLPSVSVVFTPFISSRRTT